MCCASPFRPTSIFHWSTLFTSKQLLHHVGYCSLVRYQQDTQLSSYSKLSNVLCTANTISNTLVGQQDGSHLWFSAIPSYGQPSYAQSQPSYAQQPTYPPTSFTVPPQPVYPQQVPMMHTPPSPSYPPQQHMMVPPQPMMMQPPMQMPPMQPMMMQPPMQPQFAPQPMMMQPPMQMVPPQQQLPPQAVSTEPVSNTGYAQWPVGTFYIRSKLNGLVLDVKGESKSSGADIITWSMKGSDNQKWKFESDGVIRSVSSGLVLDVKGGASGVDIIQYTYNGGPNQKWLWDGIHIISKMNGKYLDIKGANQKTGGDIIIWQPNNGKNQEWELLPV